MPWWTMWTLCSVRRISKQTLTLSKIIYKVGEGNKGAYNLIHYMAMGHHGISRLSLHDERSRHSCHRLTSTNSSN